MPFIFQWARDRWMPHSVLSLCRQRPARAAFGLPVDGVRDIWSLREGAFADGTVSMIKIESRS